MSTMVGVRSSEMDVMMTHNTLLTKLPEALLYTNTVQHARDHSFCSSTLLYNCKVTKLNYHLLSIQRIRE